jgi:hypothetical protein
MMLNTAGVDDTQGSYPEDSSGGGWKEGNGHGLQ